MLDNKLKKKIIASQRNEITEHLIYQKLAKSTKDFHNKKILEQFSKDELKHYNMWKKHTEKDVNPYRLNIWKYFLISKIFGITFGLKLMEGGEKKAQITYDDISKTIPSARNIMKDENRHEKQLLGLIDEERLRYVSSMVLGVSDALVELTGTLAGLTLALKKTILVAMAGLITGIAAALSMAASEYLSTKEEETAKDPFKASIYTGLIYFLTVMFLVFPFLIFTNIYFSLGLTILSAVIVIFIFTFYVSVAKDIPFKKRFFEMILIILGVATITFVIGFLVKIVLNVDI
jgi:VIT1/CCC1 family predicted Fe2+/Mn2+ transporter